MVTAVHVSDLSPKHVDAYLFVSNTIMSMTDEVKNKKKISFTNDGMVMRGPPLPVNACVCLDTQGVDHLILAEL